MGIRLDWQIESEQTETRATEDPQARQRRIQARNRLIMLIVGLAGVLGLVVVAVVWRLRSVDNQYRQDLIDTVEIEITALRLGDYANYMAVQRSASSAFMLEQSSTFEDYQALKQAQRVQFSSEVVDVAIDNLRGRVVVEEVIDGIPYHVVWFYWYYEDNGDADQGGWRRVPDDLTFWGADRTLEGDRVKIEYQELDTELAEALYARLEDWWGRGCAVLGCLPPPKLTVEIVAERPGIVEWAAYDEWRLRITSPLVGRARADVTLAADLEQEVALAIADRLIRYAGGAVEPHFATDAAWLRAETARWLAETLRAGPNGDAAQPGFMGSLVAQYGPGTPTIVLTALQQGAVTLDGGQMPLTGISLAQFSADQLNSLAWQDFFQWRLDLEAQLVGQLDERGSFMGLYDLDDLTATANANARFDTPGLAPTTAPRVSQVTITVDAAAGQTYAYVDVLTPSGDSLVNETIIWRLAHGSWKRVT